MHDPIEYRNTKGLYSGKRVSNQVQHLNREAGSFDAILEEREIHPAPFYTAPTSSHGPPN